MANYSLEGDLLQAIQSEDQVLTIKYLSQGAKPNATTKNGRTCLGEAAKIGNIEIFELLLNNNYGASSSSKENETSSTKNQSPTSHKQNLEPDDKNLLIVKSKFINNLKLNNSLEQNETSEKTEECTWSGSNNITTDEKSMSSPSQSSAQRDLEWDEEIGDNAPSTSEDEIGISSYKWYAKVMENVGLAVESALKLNHGINQQDMFMKTALHYASAHGHVKIVQRLLEAGARVNISSVDSITPLHEAVLNNHIEVVRFLLTAGSNVNCKNCHGLTPLHFAALEGYLDLVRILLRNGADLEKMENNEKSALFLAARKGHTDIIKYFIFSGCNINREDAHGYTALCEAVFSGHVPVVRILLESGARIRYSQKLLHHAIVYELEEIVKMLVKFGGRTNLHCDEGETPLLVASEILNANIIRILLKKGANVNSRNIITGVNALHTAVDTKERSPRKFEEVLKVLLEYHIDINFIAFTGGTALNRALLRQKYDEAILLIRYGADVSICDFYPDCLDNLSLATRQCCDDVVRMLVKAGHHTFPDPDVNSTKPDGTINWIYYASRRPLNLIDLCRIKIRAMANNKILHIYVSSLPVPNAIKRIIMMEDDV